MGIYATLHIQGEVEHTGGNCELNIPVYGANPEDLTTLIKCLTEKLDNEGLHIKNTRNPW